jgi:glycosyltransferase involved in cell wall biosynthesis
MTFADAVVLVLALVGLLLLVPVVVLLVEVLASLLKVRAPQSHATAARVVVLVPAHDEAVTIGKTVASLLPELGVRDRLLVVADNCTDDTAAIARAGGAEVIARSDTSRRGKGYALDFGVRHLAEDPPDVVVVIDADCRTSSGCIARIASLSAASGRPVQARYVINPPEGARSLYLSMASFAWRVKNLVRPLGCLRLGLGCQLMGTGMAVPWSLIGRSNLATSEIVEDLVLGLEFARAGAPPLFCPDVVVVSEFPLARTGQKVQRERWEAGHLSTIAGRLPGLLVDAVRRADGVLLALVLDAAVPPLAFLAVAILAFTVLALPAAIIAGSFYVFKLAIAICLLFATAVLVAWWRGGRDILSFWQLVLAPGYVLPKLGTYVRLLAGRRPEWIRSDRSTHG